LQTKPSKQAPPLDTARAREMSSALASDSITRLRSVIDLPDNQRLSSSSLGQLKAISPVTFDSSTFRDHHDGTARIVAHIAHPGSGASNWDILLINRDGKWKISFSDPL
jgi:hypothetical protein